jgi:hypothetical protein
VINDFSTTENAYAHTPYLLLFAGDKDQTEQDVLRCSAAARIIATVPMGLKASVPHHMEYWLPPRREPLFMNTHHAEQTLLFNARGPGE